MARAHWKGRGNWTEKASPEKSREPIGWNEHRTDVLDAERRAMGDRRGVAREDVPGKVVPEKLAGLAISGGGIRSATFALGVLQALAAKGRLSRFDYLSTVSGGGYLGTSLTWLLGRDFEGGPKGAKPFGLERQDFPYGTDDPEPPKPGNVTDAADDDRQKAMLRHLRDHASYLAPSQNITLMSGVAVVLRGVIANLVTWLSILVATFLLLSCVGSWLTGQDDPGNRLWIAVVLAAVASGGFLIWCVVYALFTWQELFSDGPRDGEPIRGWLKNRARDVYKLTLWLRGEEYSEEDQDRMRYELRRLFDVGAGLLLKMALGLLAVASLPVAAEELGGRVEEAGILSVLFGAVSGLVGFLQVGKGKYQVPVTAVVGLGAIPLLYGVLLLAYSLAGLLSGFGGVVWIGPLLVLGACMGTIPNPNLVGLHRFYRDRLMETFMPEPSTVCGECGPVEEEGGGAGAGRGERHPIGWLRSHLDRLKTSVRRLWLAPLGDLKTGESQEGNQAMLSEVLHRGPYHLINTNVVLVDSARRKLKTRGGDSFVLSPLFCGSDATGYCKTSELLNGRLTLASAMAVSGAAANPNTGVGGAGPMRNQWVALLMFLLNIRLGFWIPHPMWRETAKPHKGLGSWYEQDRRPSHFQTMLTEIRATGYDELAKYLELSDGGHFDNLGLYELVRRRCGFILVIDGATDPEARFEDLRIASERIWEDFRARVDFESARVKSGTRCLPIEAMIPGATGGAKAREKEAISDALLAERGFAIGQIVYHDEKGNEEGERGTLVYIKSTMVKDLSLRVRGYRRAHPQFPDETVADQLFDESQFEAYRHLGYKIAKSLLREPGLDWPQEWEGETRGAGPEGGGEP